MTNSRNAHLFVSVILSFFWLVLSVPTWAQKDAGSIVGTVKDGTGAVVPNADIEVSDVERGQILQDDHQRLGRVCGQPVARWPVQRDGVKGGFQKGCVRDGGTECAGAYSD